MVVHPKQLPEKTLFAIDQFILKGGRAIVCVDPHCISDPPDRQQQQFGGTQHKCRIKCAGTVESMGVGNAADDLRW
jgi:hypothetical protein